METSPCCPKFDPAIWQDKTHQWHEKLFLTDQVIQFMHLPLNFGSVVKRMIDKIQTAKAMPDNSNFLMLCYDPSPWKCEIFMTVTNPIDNGTNVKLSGKLISRVYDGPYQAVPQWIKDMDAVLAQKQLKAKKYYFHYAYCPKCVKTYGHNYVIAFAEI